MSNDYLAFLIKESQDAEQFGIKGMKWGVRRSKRELQAQSSNSSEKTNAGAETSSERYTRLMAKAKTQGANSFTDEELRFVTARGNAIAQVNRLNERKPGWATAVATKVIKNAAQKQMTSVANTLSQKYIGDALKTGS